MTRPTLPDIRVPADMAAEEMPDLLRYWYLGTKARRHMMLRRFSEVDGELPEPGGGRTLDIGSAWGYHVMALSGLGYRAVGLDLVVDQFPAGARIARASGSRFLVVGGDAAALPFSDAAFEGVTMVETLEHIYEGDRRRALEECYRVLGPGGTLVLSTPNYEGAVERAKRVAVRFPWLRRRLPTMCYPAGDVGRTDYHPYRYHRPTPESELVRELRAAGFRVTKVKRFLFVLKSTPDGLSALTILLERCLERLPWIRRLAATLCVVARKSL